MWKTLWFWVRWKRKGIKNISKKKRINEIKRLKEEVKNNENKLLGGETKISKLLIALEYEKNDTVHNIVVLRLKLIKLETSPERIDRIKSSVLSS